MSNQAAWLTEAKAKPLKVDEAEMWKPAEGEILVKNEAWAINPGIHSVAQPYKINYPRIGIVC